MPIQNTSPSANFKFERTHNKFDHSSTFFQFKQHKLFTTQAVNFSNATTTGGWTPYIGNFKPKKAENSQPSLFYNTNNNLYEGLFTATTGFTATTAGALRTTVVNLPVANNVVHRFSCTTPTAGTYTINYYSDSLATTLIGSVVVNVTASDINKTLYATYNSTIAGTQAVVGNTKGEIAVNVLTGIPIIETIKAVRITTSAIAMTIFELQMAHNSYMLSGVLHNLGLSCLDSSEEERNLETAEQMCNDIEEGTTATSDGLIYKYTVNSTSIKMLALGWGQLSRTENTTEVVGSQTVTLGTSIFGGITLSSSNVGTGLAITNIRMGEETMTNFVSNPTLIEYDNFIYDTVTGILYMHQSYVGVEITLGTNQNVVAQTFDMKALELGYYMSGQVTYLNSKNQRYTTKISKAMITKITRSNEDANDKFEIEMKLYPDSNKNFGKVQIS